MIEEFIFRFAEKQKRGWHLCPRCGCDRMNKDAARNALSRRADIMICDICGSIEGIEDIEDMPGNKRPPLEKWALMEKPEKFFLRGKDYFTFYTTFGSWEGFPLQTRYCVVEGFDREDARERFRRHFPDKTPGAACSAFDYSESKHAELSQKWPCAGMLRLNDRFEPAE